MEEIVFMKCEPPEWQLDEEESLSVEDPLSPSDVIEEMKVEPVDVVDDKNIIEGPAVVVKVKQEIQDVKEEIQIEDCSIREAPSNKMESSPSSKKSKLAVKRTKNHQYTEDGKLCHCSICGKTFTHGRYLKNHLVVHTRERKMCLICKKKFLRQSTLKRHMLLHFDVNRFACSICGKLFTRCSNLKTHMFVHSLHQRSAAYGYM